MRAVGIFFVSALCTQVHGYNSQQPLGSLDLSGSSYKCDNGVKPSIACVDPATNHDICSCTCTNGIKFEQPLDPFSSTASGPSGLGLGDNSACQADHDVWNQREQTLNAQVMELTNKLTDSEQKHVQREQELLDQLVTCPFKYQGCYEDPTSVKHVVHDIVATADKTITLESCRTKCQGYKYFGINNGWYCACGNTYTNTAIKVDDAKCNAPCQGNPKQTTCGGPWLMSVYSQA